MEALIKLAKEVTKNKEVLPFSVYSSIKEQRILNVPILKPLLICVLSGCKQLGKDNEIICPGGSFVFLSNRPTIDMRNVPQNQEYFALLIEFEFNDFDCFNDIKGSGHTFIQGELKELIQNSLQQFVEWSVFAPVEIWPARRKEMLQLMYHVGYKQVSTILESPNLTHTLHNLIKAHIADDLSVNDLSEMLAMSPSTLRRKLLAEGTSLQAIKDQVKLSHGLHLVQTTLTPISLIAEQCGYLSQSRFTDKFKQLFGITPSQLRRTRLND